MQKTSSGASRLTVAFGLALCRWPLLPRNVGGLWIVIVCVLLFGLTARTATQPANQSSPLGTNLAELRDYESEYPFVDAFKKSRDWVSGRRFNRFEYAGPLDLDEHGWVRSLDGTVPEGGQAATTILFAALTSQYPGGTYTVLYDGEGTLQYWGGGPTDVSSPSIGRDLVEVNPALGDFFLTIETTDPNNTGNYIRNIRVLMPGTENDPTQLFHPTFLSNISRYKVLRFMNWMGTNGSTVTEMSDYPTLDDARWPTAPVEIMAALANRVEADVWITIPHQASDAFVREFATQLRDSLSPNLRIYVEYSNEVWNTIFPQHLYVAKRGCEIWPELAVLPDIPPSEGFPGMVVRGCDEDSYQNDDGSENNNAGNGIYCEGHPYPAWNEGCFAGLRRYYPRRSMEIWAIFADVFGGTDRLVRVMASQSGVPWLHGEYLGWENAAQQTDVLATAPYFGGSYGGERSVEAVNWTVDDLFFDLEKPNGELDATFQRMSDDASILQQPAFAHLRLVAYEGGQHMVGIFGNENNDTLNALFDAANRHPRMGDVYTRYLQGWRARGGDMFVHFQNVGLWGKFGRWGALEYQDQPHAESPKYQALMAFIEASSPPVNVAPEATAQDVTVKEDLLRPITLTGSDVNGDPLTFTIVAPPLHGVLTGTPPNVTYDSHPDYNGPDTFTFRTSDGSLNSADATVSITVKAVNDPPVNSVPGRQRTSVNIPLIFSAALRNAISIADVDAGRGAVSVRLKVSNGSLTLSDSTGLTFNIGDGTADGSMAFTGTIPTINAALKGMRFTPGPGFVGNVDLTILTSDLGQSGAGGELSDMDTVRISVSPIVWPGSQP